MLRQTEISSGCIKQCPEGKLRSYCYSDPAPEPFGNHCEWVNKAGFLDDNSLSTYLAHFTVLMSLKIDAWEYPTATFC